MQTLEALQKLAVAQPAWAFGTQRNYEWHANLIAEPPSQAVSNFYRRLLTPRNVTQVQLRLDLDLFRAITSIPVQTPPKPPPPPAQARDLLFRILNQGLPHRRDEGDLPDIDRSTQSSTPAGSLTPHHTDRCLLYALPPDDPPSPINHARTSKSSSTDLPKRSFTLARALPESTMAGVRFDKRELRWKASWSSGGRRNCRSFSVRRYGYTGARSMAVEARRDAEMLGGVVSPGESLQCCTCQKKFLGKRGLVTHARACVTGAAAKVGADG